jgi:hypothetical protein
MRSFRQLLERLERRKGWHKGGNELELVGASRSAWQPPSRAAVLRHHRMRHHLSLPSRAIRQVETSCARALMRDMGCPQTSGGERTPCVAFVNCSNVSSGGPESRRPAHSVRARTSARVAAPAAEARAERLALRRSSSHARLTGALSCAPAAACTVDSRQDRGRLKDAAAALKRDGEELRSAGAAGARRWWATLAPPIEPVGTPCRAHARA